MSRALVCVIAFLLMELGLTTPVRKTVGKKAKYCDYENIKIKIGETISIPGKCILATCLSDSISAFTCADFTPAPGCHGSKIDYSKPYPECCPQNFCD